MKEFKLLKKRLYGPFLWIGFNCLKAAATSRRQFTFYHSFPRNSWYSFYWPRKDERLSRPWSHPVVLNTGPLDWESSTLTSGPLLLGTLPQAVVMSLAHNHLTNLLSRVIEELLSANLSSKSNSVVEDNWAFLYWG